jgi:hypothetical protein
MAAVAPARDGIVFALVAVAMHRHDDRAEAMQKHARVNSYENGDDDSDGETGERGGEEETTMTMMYDCSWGGGMGRNSKRNYKMSNKFKKVVLQKKPFSSLSEFRKISRVFFRETGVFGWENPFHFFFQIPKRNPFFSRIIYTKTFHDSEVQAVASEQQTAPGERRKARRGENRYRSFVSLLWAKKTPNLIPPLLFPFPARTPLDLDEHRGS